MRPERVALAVFLLAGFVPVQAAALEDSAHDDFHHLVMINKASLVMLTEQDLLPAALAQDIAIGIDRVAREQARAGSARSANYLDFEARLIEVAGREASRLHTGRSRQDIGSTYRRMALRHALIDTFSALLDARRVLLELAAEHVDTVIPAYTHGVQAQPTTLGHYLLAFAAGLERDADRLQAAWTRLDLSPLGAAALGTSGFSLDRARLAELLGFGGVVENSYDANLVSSVDSKIEFVSALSASAVVVGQLMQNLHTQYHDPHPWILLADSETSGSSIMPQKRNPRPLDRVRLLASGVVADAHAVTLNAHNTNSGMNDYRPASRALESAAGAQAMYRALAGVLSSLVIDVERARDEVDLDYSTMTEIADLLLREAEVPFREGHHYASELTSYGRAAGKAPRQLSDEELLAVYRNAIGEPLPLPVERVREAMDPAAMIRNRRGLGGPQRAEVLRMLARHSESIERDTTWIASLRQDLTGAEQNLERAFDRLP